MEHLHKLPFCKEKNAKDLIHLKVWRDTLKQII